VVRSPSAPVNEYGEVVRDSGMGVSVASVPVPAGRTPSALRPRMVLVLMSTPVALPSVVSPPTVNVIRTCGPSSRTSDTVPTLTPATIT